VAGNFAGHLEQAGEAADFASVDGSGDAPKGIFPFYVPGDDGFLGGFPLSPDTLLLPDLESDWNLQIEPELGVVLDLDYAPDGSVRGLAPVAAGAFNDCSIRRDGAKKISEKKNWGPCSKGLAARLFAIDDLDPAGSAGALRIASFLRREGVVHEYGVDSPYAGYSYSGARLLEWIADRLNHQQDSPLTPLEDLGAMLRAAGLPARAVVGIGATRYTPFGESNFLVAGDASIVIVYDANAHSPERVATAVAAAEEERLDSASVLVQRVRTGG